MIWIYEYLQTKPCVFTEIYHTPHFLCVEGIGMNLLQGLQVSGWKSLWLITCCKHHIALFSLYEFFPLGFSYKVFNETISTQGYVISSIFSIGVFGGWYWDIRCIVLFSLCEFSIYGFSYKVLMRQCQHKGICYIIYFFSPRFLEDDIWSILTIWSRCF